MIPNYIGESLAALLPAILSLAQGLGQDPGCHNVTDPTTNQTNLEPITIKPNYSVRVYFILLFLLLCISTTSFSLLNFSKIAKSVRVKSSNLTKSDNRIEPLTNKSSYSSDELEFNTSLNDSKEKILDSDNTSRLNANVVGQTQEKIILLSIILAVSFICYGVLPGKKNVSNLFD